MNSHRGTVEVVGKDRAKQNIKLGECQFFGENSFFFHERRNASIHALT